MIALWLQLGLAHGGADPVADALTEALRIELDLALETLHLPGHPSPHFIAYEVLDGQVATAEASLGAIVIESQVPHRKLRVDVRVGSPALDSSNFSSFGARGGVEARGLPLEPNVVAFRREIWLATDEAHKGAVETYATKMAAREGQPGPFLPDQAPAKPLQGEPIPVPAVDLGVLSELTRTLSGMWREVPGIEKAQVTARDWQGRRLLLTSEGTQIWMPTGATVVRLTAAVRNEAGALVHTHRNWVARSPADLPTLAQMEDEVASARDWLMAAKAAPVEEEFLGPFVANTGNHVFPCLVAYVMSEDCISCCAPAARNFNVLILHPRPVRRNFDGNYTGIFSKSKRSPALVHFSNFGASAKVLRDWTGLL